MVPLTLYRTGIVCPPPVCMVPPHVKCLHVLYASYGTPYLIWNRYCMVPPHVCYDVNDTYDPPIPYME